MSALLAIEGVSKRFRGLVAVDRVACEVAQGEIFAVIGPNGAGKTTLFNMIAGALQPDEGAITWRGERIDGLRPDEICRRGIARTFQIVRPFPALTVEDNVMVGALLRSADVARAVATSGCRACAPTATFSSTVRRGNGRTIWNVRARPSAQIACANVGLRPPPQRATFRPRI